MIPFVHSKILKLITFLLDLRGCCVFRLKKAFTFGSIMISLSTRLVLVSSREQRKSGVPNSNVQLLVNGRNSKFMIENVLLFVFCITSQYTMRENYFVSDKKTCNVHIFMSVEMVTQLAHNVVSTFKNVIQTSWTLDER